MKIRYLILITVLSIFSYAQEFPVCEGIGNQTRTDVAFDGTAYIVVYDSVGDIWGARVDKEGNVITRFAIDANQTYNDSLPAIATDGNKCCVVWYRSGGAWAVQGAIIQGTSVIRRFNVEISSHYRCRPAIAFSSFHNLYLIVTNTLLSPTICGIFYDSNGYIAYSSFLIESGGQYDGFGDAMITATNNTNNNYVVIYSKRVENISGYKTYYVRYALVTPPHNVQIYTLKSSQSALSPVPGNFMLYPPSVAYNGTECFCAYQFFEENPPITGNLDIIGARIDPDDGTIIQNDIEIAKVSSRDEYAPATTAENECYFICWQDNRSSDLNLFAKQFDQNGNLFGDEVTITKASGNQEIAKVAFDGLNKLVVWQDYRNATHYDIWGSMMPKIWTDDPLALAYNGNRHLIRKQPNNETLHLVYTDNGDVIYRYSSNGGATWALPTTIGEGKFPAMTLTPGDYTPAVTWTDDIGGLWYAKRQPELPPAWDVYHLYDPWGPYDPYLNSPPSISIVDHGGGNFWVHILVARTGRIQSNGVIHTIDDCSFPISNPGQMTFTKIDQGESEPNEPCRTNPSIIKDDWNTLHAVWQRRDTICYALKSANAQWNVWGYKFAPDGVNSSHPFVETYGDYVYVVWQQLHPITQKEDIYLGTRHLMSVNFICENFSGTPTLVSVYPVNASGFFTMYAGEPSAGDPYEIYCNNGNISQTPDVMSIYPHSAARSTALCKYLYTAWLEGNSSPYQILFRKIVSTNSDNMDIPYLSSFNGHNSASPYLIERDGYISDWQIPVDIGYNSITYRLLLYPEYTYRLWAIVYQEKTDKWKMKFYVDGGEAGEIEYNPYVPETLDLWITPECYTDSVVDLMFKCENGDFAAVGPLYVFRYEEEYEGGGGPMAYDIKEVGQSSVILAPNPFTTSLKITFQNQTGQMVDVKVYDALGCLVKRLYNGTVHSQKSLYWNGVDDNGRIVSQGIYFVQVRNLSSGETTMHKVLRIR